MSELTGDVLIPADLLRRLLTDAFIASVQLGMEPGWEKLAAEMDADHREAKALLPDLPEA